MKTTYVLEIERARHFLNKCVEDTLSTDLLHRRFIYLLLFSNHDCFRAQIFDLRGTRTSRLSEGKVKFFKIKPTTTKERHP